MPVRRKGGEEVNYFNKNKRLYAFLAAFLVTAVLLLSGLFIVTHAEHDCTGEDLSLIHICFIIIIYMICQRRKSEVILWTGKKLY